MSAYRISNRWKKARAEVEIKCGYKPEEVCISLQDQKEIRRMQAPLKFFLKELSLILLHQI
jgi:hypothetical protein